MALNSPQADLPSRLRGGADTWDDGAAGLILSGEFFAQGAAPTVYDVGVDETVSVDEAIGASPTYASGGSSSTSASADQESSATSDRGGVAATTASGTQDCALGGDVAAVESLIATAVEATVSTIDADNSEQTVSTDNPAATCLTDVYAEGFSKLEDLNQYTNLGFSRVAESGLYTDGYRFTESTGSIHYLVLTGASSTAIVSGKVSFVYQLSSGRSLRIGFNSGGHASFTSDGTFDPVNSDLFNGKIQSVVIEQVGSGYNKVSFDLVGDDRGVSFGLLNAGSISYTEDPTKSLFLGGMRFLRGMEHRGVPAARLDYNEGSTAQTPAIDSSDFSWLAGSTNINESQSDAATSLDASTVLMLALLAEYEAATAIDLPAGQYTVINDASETALGVDAPVGSYTTTSARTEAGSAGSADDVDQSTGVSGVALGTASEAASNIASITAARSESGISVETQAGSMNTTKTQAEVGDLSDAGLSTMVTTGTSVEAVVAIDSLSQTVTTAVSLFAGLGATEAQVTIYSFTVADLEGTLADANQSGSANFASTGEEGTSALEASGGSANLGLSLTETTLATEESGYQTNVLNLSRTEASPLVDVPSSVMVAFAQITGAGTLAEVVQGSNTTQSSNLEALVSAAIHAGVMNWLSQAAELVTSGGTPNSNVSTNTTTTEAVTSNTYADNGGSTTAVAQEPTASGDDLQGTAVSLISRTEPAAAGDFSSQGATTQAASTEAAAPSESASTLVAGAAATTATGTATDLPGATHSGFATSQELADAADQINAGLLTILSTVAAAVGGEVSTAVGSIDLTLADVAQATEETAEVVAFTGTLLEVVSLGDDYLCTLVSDITLDEQATAVTLQLADLNVILDVLKLQNVFLVSREVRGHRIGMDLRDLVVEIERRGFEVPQDIREIAVGIECRSYNVTK